MQLPLTQCAFDAGSFPTKALQWEEVREWKGWRFMSSFKCLWKWCQRVLLNSFFCRNVEGDNGWLSALSNHEITRSTKWKSKIGVTNTLKIPTWTSFGECLVNSRTVVEIYSKCKRSNRGHYTKKKNSIAFSIMKNVIRYPRVFNVNIDEQRRLFYASSYERTMATYILNQFPKNNPIQSKKCNISYTSSGGLSRNSSPKSSSNALRHYASVHLEQWTIAVF